MGTTLQVWKRRRGKWAALKKQWAAVKEREREREWETECVSCYFDGSERSQRLTLTQQWTRLELNHQLTALVWRPGFNSGFGNKSQTNKIL